LQLLSARTKMQLLDDAFTLASSNEISYVPTVMNLAKMLDKETNYYVLASGFSGLSDVAGRLKFTPAYEFVKVCAL
jgi:hypothetical protein